MELGLTGKSVLITGASRGIGAATALAFAREGTELHLSGRDTKALESIAGKAQEAGAQSVTTHIGDMQDHDFLDQLGRDCSQADILINNAGATPTGSLEVASAEDWAEGMALKVTATALLTRELYKHMCKRGDGVIINVIGNCGERPDPEIIIGTVANAGMMNFTRALGSVSPQFGVRVVGVNPGPTSTERLVSLMQRKSKDRTGDEDRWEELTEPLPLGRAAYPEEQADVIVFAASERASFVSGTIFTVDSGVAARGHIF